MLADDDVKVQLNQEVDDLKTATEVSKALDEKLAWLDDFNKNIIDYDKICTDLEAIVVKDRKDLDDLIKPPAVMKSTDRLVSAMDLADDIRAQEEIATAKQQLWDQGLAPEGKENTPEVRRDCLLFFNPFVKLRQTIKVSTKQSVYRTDRHPDSRNSCR